MKLKAAIGLLVCISTLSVLLSCNRNNSDLVVAMPTGMVAFFNLIPNGTPVSGSELLMYVNGTRLNTNKIAYDDYSGYMPTLAGDQSVLFKTDSLRNNLFDPAVTVNIPKDSLTIFVTGKTAGNLIFARDSAKVDTLTIKPKLRFVNASADSPAYDLSLTTTAVNAAINNTSYKGVSAFVRADTGAVTLKLKLAGTSNTIISSKLTLQPKKVYTLFVYGSYTGANGSGLNLGVITNR